MENISRKRNNRRGKGFEKPIEVKIKPEGILASELISLSEETSAISVKEDIKTKASSNTNMLYWIFGLGFILMLIVSMGIKKNRTINK
ncbi:hypothetical protein [Alkaliphilus serpentinus]|uniref:Uncharacterized protein n=1 Tax=Alkaliphilus serpentinus TaxID=1482731 RepID=A0A833HNI6_9FIRM|nr:hypothetical protein [Alkaliphilus serpentinus]KAB3529412.1 hypothetical protein F8153_09265 [Alkaliphilus serpentinus]